MSRNANHFWVVACRRRLAAALCVLMLLAGLLPAHAGAQAVLADLDQAVVLTAQTDGGAPTASDAVARHAAGHCACKIAALPSMAVQWMSTLVRPASFTAAPPHALRPGALTPPAEPPRT